VAEIRVQEFKSGDYACSVFWEGRLWKRARRASIPEPWLEVVFHENSPREYAVQQATIGQARSLEKIYRDSDTFREPHRFPRADRRYDDLVMAIAHEIPSSDNAVKLIDRLRTYVAEEYGSPIAVLPSAWDSIPRFDPSLFRKTRWLIENFLVEGSVQLVYGERGAFKSTLLLCAAMAVSSGDEFLEEKTRRRRVLYLDYENPANIIKARNDDLRLDLPNNPNLVIWDRFRGQSPPRPGDPVLENVVRHCIRETGKAPWIIFDSWSSLLQPGESGESTGQIAPVYAHFRKLADMSATVTVLDHSKKYEPEVIYGGLDKEAKVDSIHALIVFNNPKRPENAIVRVQSWLKRYAPKGVGTFCFEVQSKKDENGDWHVYGLMPAKDPLHERTKQKRNLIRTLIRKHPQVGQEGLAKLAAKKGLGRDEAIAILKAGIRKYWDVEKSAHGRFIYKVR